jgi:hypothetical protein
MTEAETRALKTGRGGNQKQEGPEERFSVRASVYKCSATSKSRGSASLVRQCFLEILLGDL